MFHMMDLDEKDIKILEILKRHSDYTTRQIAKKTLLPITTIHNRIKKLKQQEIIKKFTIQIDYSKIGKSLPVIILLSADYKLLRELKKDQHQLIKEIKMLPEVEETYIVTGTTDIVVKVRVKDVTEYDEFLLKKLQKIPCVDKTQSLVVINEN